jgi:serine/threonine-protein kinase RsbW
MTSKAPKTPDSGRFELINDRDQIDAAIKTVLDSLAAHGYTESSRFAVRLAVEEALANALRHGHKRLPHTTPIRLTFQASPDDLRITITDQGPGFAPGAVPDPTLEENLELPSGRGLMLMRAYMTSVTFNDRGNQVTMLYRKPPPKKK